MQAALPTTFYVINPQDECGEATMPAPYVKWETVFSATNHLGL